MHSVVCVRFCPDVTQLRPDPSSGAPRLEGVPWRVSTLDEHAIECAVRLRERHGGSIVALSLVSVEPPAELVLKVLAMGVDEVELVVDAGADNADAQATATILAAAMRGEPDLVLFGEGSIDRFAQQVGPRVAEALDLPSVTYVSELRIEGDQLFADRLLEDQSETVRCALPAVVTIGQESAAPRLPSVLQVLGTSRKPRRVTPVGALDALSGGTSATLSRTRTLLVTAPSGTRKRVRLEGDTPQEVAEQLVRRLIAEGVMRR